MNNRINESMTNTDDEAVRVGTIWIVVGVIALFLVAYGIYVVYNNDKGKSAELDAQKIEEALTVVDEEAALPQLTKEEQLTGGLIGTEDIIIDPKASDISLPALNNSDQIVRSLITDLSSRPELLVWLSADQLINKFTALVDNIARGDLPRKYISSIAPKGKFVANAISENQYVLDPKSFSRYDYFAGLIASLNVETMVDVYEHLRPLIGEAYEQLGYAGQQFDSKLIAAIDILKKTPDVGGEIPLIRTSVMYKFADPQLESLPPAQKQLIRMGPKNAGILKVKIGEFGNELQQRLAE